MAKRLAGVAMAAATGVAMLAGGVQQAAAASIIFSASGGGDVPGGFVGGQIEGDLNIDGQPNGYISSMYQFVPEPDTLGTYETLKYNGQFSGYSIATYSDNRGSYYTLNSYLFDITFFLPLDTSVDIPTVSGLIFGKEHQAAELVPDEITLSLAPSVVPLPASAYLFGSAILALAFTRRRFQKNDPLNGSPDGNASIAVHGVT